MSLSLSLVYLHLLRSFVSGQFCDAAVQAAAPPTVLYLVKLK